LGGGFRFCDLGEPLFDERGQIKPSVRFADLARHVYFTETGEPFATRFSPPLAAPASKPKKLQTCERAFVRSNPALQRLQIHK